MKLVDELLAGRDDGALRVLDPFSGTATTPLCAASRGHEGVSVDINPFLCWLGNAKLARYDEGRLAAAMGVADDVVCRVRDGLAQPAPAPPMHNIARWWEPTVLSDLRCVRGALDSLPDADPAVVDLLTVAFCRTVIDSSNASFGHVSMSFRGQPGRPGQSNRDGPAAPDVLELFRQRAVAVVEGAAPNPPGRGRVVRGDARALDALRGEVPFDLVITSPPYANRMSYIRELRPYMYWTGHVAQASEAGELDWQAIGGTWGIATSRLSRWRRDRSVQLPADLERAVTRIEGSGEKNGPLLSRYVARYFEDASRHLGALHPHVRPGGELHYVVGNSKFYEELVQVQEIYAELMLQHGFTDVEIHPLRKRNSKKELYEYDVSARRP
ncbi:MAG: hypothetical protein PVI30_04320 [Myxococcales bacterium]